MRGVEPLTEQYIVYFFKKTNAEIHIKVTHVIFLDHPFFLALFNPDDHFCIRSYPNGNVFVYWTLGARGSPDSNPYDTLYFVLAAASRLKQCLTA